MILCLKNKRPATNFLDAPSKQSKIDSLHSAEIRSIEIRLIEDRGEREREKNKVSRIKEFSNYAKYRLF